MEWRGEKVSHHIKDWATMKGKQSRRQSESDRQNYGKTKKDKRKKIVTKGSVSVLLEFVAIFELKQLNYWENYTQV